MREFLTNKQHQLLFYEADCAKYIKELLIFVASIVNDPNVLNLPPEYGTTMCVEVLKTLKDFMHDQTKIQEYIRVSLNYDVVCIYG